MFIDNSHIERVLAAAYKAQELVNDLYERDPTNQTFEQAGMLDGQQIIQDFIAHNEWGLGLEPLLYMIHESDIRYPVNDLLELHSLASRHGIRNFYDQGD